MFFFCMVDPQLWGNPGVLAWLGDPRHIRESGGRNLTVFANGFIELQVDGPALVIFLRPPGVDCAVS